MRTHLTGILLLFVCIGLLALITQRFLEGENSEVIWLTVVFLFVIAVLGVLIALFPSVRRAFTAD